MPYHAGPTLRDLRRPIPDMHNPCEIHTITSGPHNHNHAYPTCRTWSRDGKCVFIESSGPGPDGKVEEGRGHILSIDIESGGVKYLASMVGGCYGFDYSPGANCIAYLDGSGHELHVLNLDTMTSGTVFHEPAGVMCGPLSISRDGTRIVYWSMFPSAENRYFDDYITVIFALDVDPVDCGLVTGPWIVEAYPRRKGKTWDRNHRDGIHVNHPQINPADKDHICYSHEMLGATPDGSVAMCRLWEVRADGDDNRYLVRQVAGLHFTHEVIAPDGKSLVFPYMHGVGQVDFGTLERRSLYYNSDCCPGHLTVSPDQKWIAGDTWGDWKDDQGRAVQSVMMFDVETRKCAHLCWITRSRGHPGHPHPNFSPGGTKIAFTHLVDGFCQVAYIDVSCIMANWDTVAQGRGEEASPEWR